MNKIKIFTDDRGGNLLPFEFIDLPFTPKRIFIAQPEDIKKNRNLWIQEWLKALSKR